MIAYPLLKNTANPGIVVPRRASSANIPPSYVGRMPLPDLKVFSNSSAGGQTSSSEAPHLLWPSRQLEYGFVVETRFFPLTYL